MIAIVLVFQLTSYRLFFMLRCLPVVHDRLVQVYNYFIILSVIIIVCTVN